MRHGGLATAAETIACAEIAARDLRIGVEVERVMEAAARLPRPENSSKIASVVCAIASLPSAASADVSLRP
jgi:hypothetical protein